MGSGSGGGQAAMIVVWVVLEGGARLSENSPTVGWRSPVRAPSR